MVLILVGTCFSLNFVCSEDKMMKTREIVESNKNKVQRYREVKKYCCKLYQSYILFCAVL